MALGHGAHRVLDDQGRNATQNLLPLRDRSSAPGAVRKGNAGSGDRPIDLGGLTGYQKAVVLALAQSSRHPLSRGLAATLRAEGITPALLDGIATVRKSGKAAGILATDPTLAQRYLEAGAQFVAVGVDTTLLVRAATELAQRFKPLH